VLASSDRSCDGEKTFDTDRLSARRRINPCSFENLLHATIRSTLGKETGERTSQHLSSLVEGSVDDLKSEAAILIACDGAMNT